MTGAGKRNSMIEKYKFNLPIETPEALRQFVDICFGIQIPDTVVIPGHSTPWQAFCDSYFAKNRVTVWEASRGLGGKSFLLAALGLINAITLRADVKVLGGSGAQSTRVQNYISDFYKKDTFLGVTMNRGVWDGEPLSTVSRFVWGNSIQALMASQTSVRGPHPQRLLLDEVDEMALPIFRAAMGQTMSKFDGEGNILIPAQTTISSTHHNPDGTMTEVLKMAREKGWPVHRWSYHETSVEGGWLPKSEIEAKKAEIPSLMWTVEYELQEPTSENRAIVTDKIETMFQKSLGEYEGSAGEYVETQSPEANSRYATGADWAKGRDWTVIVTLKQVERKANNIDSELIAFERRNREPWPKMINRFDKRVNRFKGDAAHDQTGIGDVVHDYLSVDATGIIMQGNARKKLFSDYITAIEDGRIISPMIMSMYSEHKYASYDDLYGSGHPPDSIVAGAMAWSARNRGGWVW